MSSVEIGKQLGDYVVKRLLSTSPLGDVFMASNQHNNNAVVTVLSEAVSLNPPVLESFKTDFKRLSTINHRAIAKTGELIEDDSIYFVSYLSEESTCVSDVVNSGKIFQLESAITVIKNIARALDDTWHKHGIIHSSLRPENIFVNKDNTVKILHFGLEECIDSNLRSTVKSSKNLKKNLNTNRYRCPVMAHSDEYSCRSDMYSLGVCFYELLTADEPYISKESEIVTHLLHDENKIDRLIQRNFPTHVIDLIASMIATDPELRPKQWSSVVQELNQMNQTSTFKVLKAPDKEIEIDSDPQSTSVFIVSIVILIMALILFLLSILLTNKLLAFASLGLMLG